MERLEFTVENVRNYFQFEDYFCENSTNDTVIKNLNRLTRDQNKSIKAKKKMDDAARKSVEIIKKNGLSTKTEKSINAILYDSFESIKNMVDVAASDFNGDTNKIASAIYLFLWMYIVSYTLMVISVMLFGLILGNQITIVVIAPIVEEFAKQVSIRGGYEKEYFVIFNAFEFTKYYRGSYGARMLLGDLGKKLVILVRSSAVGLHLTTTIVQWFTKHKADMLRENPELTKDPELDKKIQNLGYFGGVAIHMIWNGWAGNIIGGMIQRAVLGY